MRLYYEKMASMPVTCIIVNKNEDEIKSSNYIWVSLNVELKESMTDFRIIYPTG